MTRFRLMGAALLAVAAQGAVAQDDTANGQALFAAHCAYCHGEGAKGDGPQANMLNPQPRDLTVLAKQNGGVFPALTVVRRIDGREAIVAHGSPMPVFGEYFEGEDAIIKTETGQPILTSKPVADLMAWLESIQQ